MNISMESDVVNVNMPLENTSTTDAPTRAYHHGNLRAALVAEGLKALGEGEHAGVSLRELARRLGVSPNAAYRHFAGKDDLLSAMAAEGFRQFAVTVAASDAAARSLGPAGRMRAYAHVYVRNAREHPALFRLMFGYFTRQGRSEELSRAGSLTFDALRSGVAALVRAPLDDPRVTTGALYAWSLVHGLSHLALDGQIEGDVDAAIDNVIDFASRQR